MKRLSNIDAKWLLMSLVLGVLVSISTFGYRQSSTETTKAFQSDEAGNLADVDVLNEATQRIIPYRDAKPAMSKAKHVGNRFVHQSVKKSLSITGEESKQIESLIESASIKIRERESRDHVVLSNSLDQDTRVVIPENKEFGLEVRGNVMNGIREVLGNERSLLYIASLTDAFTKDFGDFGVSEKYVTVSYYEEQYWFRESSGAGVRCFRANALHPRFQHIFEIQK